MLTFLPAGDDDLAELVQTSKLAFDNDVNFGAPCAGGPDGYTSVTWHRRAILWGARIYKIVINGAVVGGIVVQPDPRHDPRVWYLNRLWLVPEYQNCGYGTRAVAFAEGTAPAARVWRLDTPAYNKRNQHFYEKLGYRRVGIRAGMVLYDKPAAITAAGARPPARSACAPAPGSAPSAPGRTVHQSPAG